MAYILKMKFSLNNNDSIACIQAIHNKTRDLETFNFPISCFNTNSEELMRKTNLQIELMLEKKMKQFW